MNFSEIGYFQLNNLIEVRIPMILLNIEKVDLKPWYNSVTRMHLENISLESNPQEALGQIKKLNYPAQVSIIVIDQNGLYAPDVVKQLEEAGFTNAFYVKGGFMGVCAEKTSAR